jgi:hypothetical protein
MPGRRPDIVRAQDMSIQPETPSAGSTVTLREVTAHTPREIFRHSVHETRQPFVAPKAGSIAEAHDDDGEAVLRQQLTPTPQERAPCGSA